MMVVLSSASPPEAGLLHHEPACGLIVDDEQIGTSDLYVTENAVMWGQSGQEGRITLQYPRISLHAIQRNPAPLIYMMIDYKMSSSGEPIETNDDDYDPDECPSTIIKFVPQNLDSLPLIYEALNKGQALHPDPVDEDSVLPMGDFMVADLDQPDTEDAASQMENLTIEQNGNAHSAEDEDDDDMFADA